MLKVSNLCVKYDNIRVLHGVNLEVGEGELVALIGANGAGKSTMLKAISGLIKIESGQITFKNKDMTNKPAHKIVSEGIIHVPEGRQVFAKMTIEENLLLGAYMQSDKSIIKQDLQRVFGLFPLLEQRLKQSAGTLSGGEQQMLAMGRALMGRPKMILLDEPSMGLSPLMTQQIFAVLKTLKKEGITMLLVEQNAYEALEISDRAYILATGSIAMKGESQILAEDSTVKKVYLGGA